MDLAHPKILEYRLIHQLPELPAASALAFYCGRCFLIGDSSQFLHVLDAGKVSRFPLTPQADLAVEPLPKKQKPDFEGLVLDAAGRQLWVLPSGSKKNRFSGALVDLDSTAYPSRAADFGPLYARVMQAADIGEKDLNIEGGGVLGKGRWFLLNRGNGPKRKNLIVLLEGEHLLESEPVVSHRLKLPELDGVPATCTDGFASDGLLFVIAAAERSESTYDDGELVGSLMACFDLAGFSPRGWCRLLGHQKFEGICLQETAPGRKTLLLCSDQDDPCLPGELYRLVLELADNLALNASEDRWEKDSA